MMKNLVKKKFVNQVGPTGLGVRLFPLAAVAALLCGANCQAGVIASDSAANYTSWTNGSGGGTGYSTWTLTGYNNSGFFLGSSTVNDNGQTLPAGDTSDIDTSGQSWGLYANNGAAATASRTFSAGPMQVGDTFSIAFDNGNIGTPLTLASDYVTLVSSTGSSILTFGFNGNATNYFYADKSQTNASTGVGFTYFGLNLTYTLTSATAYSLAITPTGSSATTTTITGTYSGSIAGFEAVNVNAGGGDVSNFYINSPILTAPAGAAVPVPASFGLLLAGTLAGGIGLMLRSRMGKRRGV